MEGGISTKATRIKHEADAMDGDYTSATYIKTEILEPVYPDEEKDSGLPTPRVDVEHINLVTDDEEDDDDPINTSTSKGKGRVSLNNRGMRPVRLYREEHKERVTIVNTEPAAAPLDRELHEFDVKSHKDGRCRPTHIADTRAISLSALHDSELQIEHDPAPIYVPIDVDIHSNVASADIESKVPAERLIRDNGAAEASSKAKSKPKVSTKSSDTEKLPVLQTEEDRAEYKRHLEDLQILARELGGLQTSSALGDESTGTVDLDAQMNTSQAQVKDKEGRLYLFQLPPVLPPLHSNIKKEMDTMDSDIEMMPVEGAPTEMIDLIKTDSDEVVIKIEPGQPHLQVTPKLITEEGVMGRLILRQSGKVELDWGGMILEIGRGAESHFLTTAAIVDSAKEKVQEDSFGVGFSRRATTAVRGTTIAMGRVMGKFVATPDWSKMPEMMD